LHRAPIIDIGSTTLAGVVSVTDMPSITDGAVYGLHVWCVIVNDVL